MANRRTSGHRRWTFRLFKRSTKSEPLRYTLRFEPLESRQLLAVAVSTPIEGDIAADEPSDQQFVLYDPDEVAVSSGSGDTTSSSSGTSSGSGTSSSSGTDDVAVVPDSSQSDGQDTNSSDTTVVIDDPTTGDPASDTTDSSDDVTDPIDDTTGPIGGIAVGPVRVEMLNHMIAVPGVSVTMPIDIGGNAAGVYSADIQVSYDASVLSTSEAQITTGISLPGATVSAVVDQMAGEITISLYSSAPVEAELMGSLLNIEFDIAEHAVPDSMTLVDLQSVTLNDGYGILSVAPRVGADSTDGAIIIDALPKLAAGRIDVTLSDVPADPHPLTGEIAILPEDLAWVDEWSSFYVAVWASSLSSGGAALAGGSLSLAYNTDLFSAVDVKFGPAFVEQTASVDDEVGRIEFEATAAVLDIGVNRSALLAEIKFAPTAADPGVSVMSDREFALAAHDLNLSVEEADLNFMGRMSDDPVIARLPDTPVIPVVYDTNQDGLIGFDDFTNFAGEFLKIDGDPTTDYDVSGRTDFKDFRWLAANYGRRRADQMGVLYPSSLIEYWLDRPLFPESGAAQTMPDSNLAQTNLGAAETQIDNPQLDNAFSSSTSPAVNDDSPAGFVVVFNPGLGGTNTTPAADTGQSSGTPWLEPAIAPTLDTVFDPDFGSDSEGWDPSYSQSDDVASGEASADAASVDEALASADDSNQLDDLLAPTSLNPIAIDNALNSGE